ncbi:hypothetical protein FSP39_010060 [Pinctada imbricata]|uniref:Tripartite motif-containing protein 2 n=1 Tax=Pinctada imbricata TaxID=66713 RepID=A0AA88XW65_PINIB|nr:hypothetical protein FSP39_010060 [Pinctada imbricata]
MFVPGDLQLIMENLGQLQTSSMSKPTNHTAPILVSRFACPLPGNTKICISKEGDVWLGGHKSRELVKVDIKGQVLRRREIQNEPNGLSMMECGDVIISPRSCDSRSVSRLLEDDREHHLFDTSPSYSAGVSVTIEQEILTCTVDGRVVRINGDGTNVQQIYKGSGEWSALHAVESTDGSIYISDPSHSAIVMSSKYGKVLSTITHTTDVQQFGRPWGMVVDKMYNILCADFDNNCVYTTHQNEQMRELVGRSHGIQSPTWLAVDNDNNLWITQKNGIINVVKYLAS